MRILQKNNNHNIVDIFFFISFYILCKYKQCLFRSVRFIFDLISYDRCNILELCDKIDDLVLFENSLGQLKFVNWVYILNNVYKIVFPENVNSQIRETYMYKMYNCYSSTNNEDCT